MQFSFIRRLFTAGLAALHVLVSIVCVAPLSVWAQSVDLEPPVVEFQPIDEGVRGERQVFTTTVSDNESVRSVVLHFRFVGASRYEVRAMQAVGNTDTYTTTIETSDVAVGVNYIQYFIEATDDAGNRTLEGFAFDPIERLLIAQQPAINEETSAASSNSGSIPTDGLSTRQKILFGLLGVVVVGALASSSSSGGGGSSEPGVDVTIVVDPLQ